MKKIYIYWFIFFICIGGITSCNLDPVNNSVMNLSNFPKTESDAQTLMTANVYLPFTNNCYGGLFNCACGIGSIGETTTDIGSCRWIGSPDWVVLQKHTWTSSNDLWVNPTKIYWYYSYLGECLLTWDRIKDISMDDSIKNRFHAEIHLARGWLGYLLYDFYGPVPLVSLDLLKSPLKNIPVARASEDSMKTFIETELKSSIDGLPTRCTGNEYGRFDKGLAYTILMKYYMETKQWAKAEECGRELMKPKYGYGLMDNYADIFKLENEGNKEIIFACVEKRGVSLQLWHDHVLPSNYPVSNKSIQRWDGFKVHWAFYHTFESGDDRLKSLVGSYMGTDGVEYNETFDVKNHPVIYTQGAVPVKYGEDPQSTGDGSQIDWIVYRYADVITLLAEAIVRNKGEVTQEAIDLLNMVRTRAKLKGYSLSDFSTKESFLNAVLLERGHELWWEGCRRSDLIRYGLFVQSAIDRGETSAPYRVRFPLPIYVINEGNGVVIQNDGY